MTLIQQLLDELNREATRTKRALEQVPAGRDDWKPHDKSMALGRLAGMIATMPAWIVLILKQDELDLTPPGGGEWKLPSQNELVAAHHKSVADARDALNSIDDTLLLTTNWRLRAGGQVVSDTPRHVALRDMCNAVPPTAWERLPKVPMPCFTTAVSPWRIVMWSIGTPN